MALQFSQAANRLRQLFITDGGPIVATPSVADQSFGGAGNTVAITGSIIAITPISACTTTNMSPGAYDGQIIMVLNQAVNSAFTIQFTLATATSLILGDTTNATVIKAANGAVFVWRAALNGGNGAWVHLAPFAG